MIVKTNVFFTNLLELKKNCKCKECQITLKKTYQIQSVEQCKEESRNQTKEPKSIANNENNYKERINDAKINIVHK